MVRILHTVRMQGFETQDEKAKAFVDAMQFVHKEELKGVIEYLCPIVDAINYARVTQ